MSQYSKKKATATFCHNIRSSLATHSTLDLSLPRLSHVLVVSITAFLLITNVNIEIMMLIIMMATSVTTVVKATAVNTTVAVMITIPTTITLTMIIVVTLNSAYLILPNKHPNLVRPLLTVLQTQTNVCTIAILKIPPRH